MDSALDRVSSGWSSLEFYESGDVDIDTVCMNNSVKLILPSVFSYVLDSILIIQ